MNGNQFEKGTKGRLDEDESRLERNFGRIGLGYKSL